MVLGRLFATSSGIPVLLVAEEDILAVGTINPRADVTTQAHVTACMSNPDPKPPTGSQRRAQARPGSPCMESFLRSTTPRPALRPLTGWRGSTPTVLASTAVFWSLSGQSEPGSRPGSMLLM